MSETIPPLESLKPAADVVFLALCAWREARGEPDEGVAGVCHAVMNRVEKPGWWGYDVMSVLFKKWQFSSLTDPNDRQLVRWPSADSEHWRRCLRIAYGVYTGEIPNPVPGADSYFDISIQPPFWATEDKHVKDIGRLRFYDVDEDYEK